MRKVILLAFEIELLFSILKYSTVGLGSRFKTFNFLIFRGQAGTIEFISSKKKYYIICIWDEIVIFKIQVFYN